MPHKNRLRELSALIMLAIALGVPLSAHAAESTVSPAANLAAAPGSTSGFTTTTQADGTAIDEIMLAVASTVVGIAFVTVVFVLHKKEQER